MDEAGKPRPVPLPLIARGEQVLLAALALVVVAGVVWRVVEYYRLGAEPLGVAPPPDGPTYRVNVNQADWVTLALVPGIGERLAKAIVEERERRGGRFESLDELRYAEGRGVKGIGEKILEKIRPYLYAGPSAPPGSEANDREEPIQMLEAR